ncbi:MAG TPA: helix-hairpin-helix domain-containing protein [Gemmataceae bacterium]|nr:helix-hairpin-helix domain-containing protein [Gemmataceae bacterium]
MPVPPVTPAAPAPPTEVVPLSRRSQVAALALLVGIAGLIGWRWCSDRFGTRPTELHRDTTHRVDLNRATRAELMQVPSIGPQLAERIVSHRESHGQFGSIEDLKGVHGIGDATLNKMRPWVTVDGEDSKPPSIEPDRLSRKPPTSPRGATKPSASSGPINVNTAGLAELDTLPNIGPVLAQRIIDERRKKPFASVDDLRRVSGLGPKRIAAIRELVTVGE